ncbi:unannotated protein [freshwater metagenome]|uniref:Unannotated protein n=1 Tax=freshwater metagenome TaxID=449393 RepID=A0A6J6YCT9_9ZZZZ
MKFWFAVSYKQLIHTFLTEKHAFEQGFLALSTYFAPGYYYYLYIDKTRSQANHTGKTGVSNFINVMQDFQPKKLRATA